MISTYVSKEARKWYLYLPIYLHSHLPNKWVNDKRLLFKQGVTFDYFRGSGVHYAGTILTKARSIKNSR